MTTKTGICVDCCNGILQPVVSRRCSRHYWQHIKLKSYNRKQSHNSSKKQVLLDCLPDVCFQANLKEWFEHHINTSNWVCENCKKYIIPFSFFAQKSSQAHILPKSIFPSLKLLTDNHLLLGTSDCGCHNKYDLSWESAKKMPVFDKARDKIKPFYTFLIKKKLKK